MKTSDESKETKRDYNRVSRSIKAKNGPSPDMSKVKYYKNDPNAGVKIDWKRVWKIYRSLKIPKDAYDPSYHDMETEGVIVSLSPRSYGKTTAWLIVALILYWEFGIVTTYVRQTKDYITPKQLRDLYDVVEFHGYIEKITHGTYNRINYYANRWTLYNQPLGSSEVEYSDSNPCTYCVGVNESDKIKSSLNLPTCNLIIYDEFIGKDYYTDEFVRFFDIVKTIFRDRGDGNVGNIVLIANTIDVDSVWFDELCVRDEVETLRPGRPKIVKTELGTTVSIEVLALNVTQKKAKSNMRFFGFKNPKLNSITGLTEQDIWAYTSCNHIPRDEDEDHPTETVIPNIYIYYQQRYTRLRIVNNQRIGLCVYVEPARRVYDDSIILTLENVYEDKRRVYGDGVAEGVPLFPNMWLMKERGRFFYATNREAGRVNAYLDACNKTLAV